MASVNYLGRIQLVEIRTQATNKTTAQLLYFTMLGRNLNNDVFFIPRIHHFNVLHSKHLTWISDVSQNSRVTVVTDNFIALLYGLVLRRSFIHSPLNHQLIVTRLTRTWPAAGPKHPPRLYMTRLAMLKTHVRTRRRKSNASSMAFFRGGPNNFVRATPKNAPL